MVLAKGYHPLVLPVLLVPQGLVPVALLWAPALAPLRVHSQGQLPGAGLPL